MLMYTYCAGISIGNLLSCANLTNLFTHIGICAAFQMTVFFLCQQQPEYHDFSQDDDWNDRVWLAFAVTSSLIYDLTRLFDYIA